MFGYKQQAQISQTLVQFYYPFSGTSERLVKVLRSRLLLEVVAAVGLKTGNSHSIEIRTPEDCLIYVTLKHE